MEKMAEKGNNFNYIVVEFVKEKSLFIVADLWLENDKTAFWPPYGDIGRCKEAAKIGEMPTSKWKRYSVRKWYQTSKYIISNKSSIFLYMYNFGCWIYFFSIINRFV